MNMLNIMHNSKSNALTVDTIGGFTLIELLVSVAIIGILSAIALPSYLNQAARTRASEAKSSLGAINRSQQAYRLEKNTFANDLTSLDVKVTGKFYSYSVQSGSATTASAITTPTGIAANVKVSSSFVDQLGDTFRQVICESNDTSVGAALAPSSGASIISSCPPAYSLMQ
jgi:type IV pilus assembly protein PilA